VPNEWGRSLSTDLIIKRSHAYEENVSAEQNQPKANARISGPLQDQKRQSGAQTAAGQGPQKAGGLRVWAGTGKKPKVLEAGLYRDAHRIMDSRAVIGRNAKIRRVKAPFLAAEPPAQAA
jgi:DNA-binding protein H-NS